MSKELTEQQKLAVTTRGGNLLVSAAAGSGKTKVLVDRLISYLTDEKDPADLDQFLIITYTKAAAAELRGKISAKLNEKLAEDPTNRHLQQQLQRLYLAKISTVHAFCSDILRESAFQADVSPDFRVAEENECLQMQTQVIDQLLEETYRDLADKPDLQFFFDTQGIGRNDSMIPVLIRTVYNSARCHEDPEKWLSNCESSEITPDQDVSKTTWGKFLIDQFHYILSNLIYIMEKCVIKAEKLGDAPKCVEVLRGNLNSLYCMVNCETWDQIHEAGVPDFGKLTFPKKISDPETVEQIKYARNLCRETLKKCFRTFENNSAQIAEESAGVTVGIHGLLELVREFSFRYDRVKKQRRVLDFSDLEHKTLDLLWGKRRECPTSFAFSLSDRFREVMVDEYQDSNEVQDAIFRALTTRKKNCFMVGDVKQSIYQFRLADPSIFLDKYKKYIPAESSEYGQDRKVMLSKNFRSGRAVIDAVNDVFSQCMSYRFGGVHYGVDEMLYEGIPHDSLNDTEVELYGINVQKDTYAEESSFVARRITELLDGNHFVRDKEGLRPIAADDIVILLRSPGSVGEEYRLALERAGIRCETGGGVDLLHAEEVSVLRGLLQVICNPLQDIPLTALLTSRVFRFTAEDLSRIRCGKKNMHFFRALSLDDSQKSLDFLQVLNSLREDARLNDVSRLLQKVLAVTRLDSLYSAMDDGNQRQQNIREFCNIAAEWEKCGHKDLGQFLDYLDSLEEKGVISGSDRSSAGAVSIMSIHKSKGLEFPVVFLCGLSRAFNLESARGRILCHKELGIGIDCVNSRQRVRYPSIMKRAISARMIHESISEEMRVLYVAMTRAKDRLIMTYAQSKLDDILSEVVYQKEFCTPEYLAGSVMNPGQWILQTAMEKTEAGEFFRISRKPETTHVSERPWLIRTVLCAETLGSFDSFLPDKSSLDPMAPERMQHFLSFVYPHMAATQTPSKQTATQLKGRVKDQEVSQGTPQEVPVEYNFRKVSASGSTYSGKARGTMIHLIMEHLDYSRCENEDAIIEQIMKLQDTGYLDDQQVKSVNPAIIYNFMKSDIGSRLSKSEEVLREFKFSILTHPTDPDLREEEVLLQGVVDCAIIEPDGITVIDFKTDFVTEETLSNKVDRYNVQVKTYASAMEQIFEKPVNEAYLYFFHLNRFVKII